MQPPLIFLNLFVSRTLLSKKHKWGRLWDQACELAAISHLHCELIEHWAMTAAPTEQLAAIVLNLTRTVDKNDLSMKITAYTLSGALVCAHTYAPSRSVRALDFKDMCHARLIRLGTANKRTRIQLVLDTYMVRGNFMLKEGKKKRQGRLLTDRFLWKSVVDPRQPTLHQWFKSYKHKDYKLVGMPLRSLTYVIWSNTVWSLTHSVGAPAPHSHMNMTKHYIWESTHTHAHTYITHLCVTRSTADRCMCAGLYSLLARADVQICACATQHLASQWMG